MSSKYNNSNTQAFSTLAWISFGISFIGMILGIIYLNLDIYQKAFVGMTYLFSISSCFVLAKVVRDKQESEELVRKIENAKTEQMISKYISSDEA
ncbi:MAG: YiaA/YiaB family inner membrane protein [Aureispira sp.]